MYLLIVQLNTKKAFDVFVKANQVYGQVVLILFLCKGVVDAYKDYGYNTADVVLVHC